MVCVLREPSPMDRGGVRQEQYHPGAVLNHWKIGEPEKESLTLYGSPIEVARDPGNNFTGIGVRCMLRF
jgi:hypothetical protein